MGDQPGAKLDLGGADLIGRKHHRGAGAQIGPDLPHRGVEAQAGEVAGAVVRGDCEVPVMPGNEMGKVGVGDLDALRPPGRPRRVDDISEVVRPDRREGLLARVFAELGRIPVEHGERRLHPRKPLHALVATDDDRAARLFGDHPQTTVGPGRVERKIGAAGDPGAQRDGDLVERAFEADADQAVPADAPVLEPARDAPRAAEEFGIGQATTWGDQRILAGPFACGAGDEV